RLSIRQCRGPDPLAVVAAQLDQAVDRRAQGAARLRPRRSALSLPGKSQDPGVSANLRGRNAALRLQPVALAAGGGARPWQLRASFAGRAWRAQHLPADRRSSVSADLARLWLLLVP